MKTPDHYTSTDMLEAAFQFRKTELWDRLLDNHIFAVTLPSGELGYCSVMGNAGSYYGIGLYRGMEGLSCFLRMAMEPKDEFEAMSRALTFDVINCNFSQANDMNFGVKESIREFSKKFDMPIPKKKGWPEFVRYKPFRMIGPVTDEKDGRDIAAALRAGTYLAELLETHSMKEFGFVGEAYPSEDGGREVPLIVDEGDGKFHLEKTVLPATEDYEYPCPEYSNEKLLESLRKKKSSDRIEVGTIYIPMNLRENPENIAPFLIQIMSMETEFMNTAVCRAPYDKEPEKLLNDLVNAITQNGKHRPSGIICTDELTAAMLRDFCKKAGIMMVLSDKSEEFEDAANFLLATFMGGI